MRSEGDSGTEGDRREITERLALLAAALDSRDWAGVSDAFTPDATGYSRTGREAVVAVVRDHLGGCGPTQHLLGNHRITVDGDRARSLTYARVHHEGADDLADRWFECCGEYDDRWARTRDGWRLCARVFTMTIRRGDFAVLRPAPPA